MQKTDDGYKITTDKNGIMNVDISSFLNEKLMQNYEDDEIDLLQSIENSRKLISSKSKSVKADEYVFRKGINYLPVGLNRLEAKKLILYDWAWLVPRPSARRFVLIVHDLEIHGNNRIVMWSPGGYQGENGQDATFVGGPGSDGKRGGNGYKAPDFIVELKKITVKVSSGRDKIDLVIRSASGPGGPGGFGGRGAGGRDASCSGRGAGNGGRGGKGGSGGNGADGPTVKVEADIPPGYSANKIFVGTKKGSYGNGGIGGAGGPRGKGKRCFGYTRGAGNPGRSGQNGSHGTAGAEGSVIVNF